MATPIPLGDDPPRNHRRIGTSRLGCYVALATVADMSSLRGGRKACVRPCAGLWGHEPEGRAVSLDWYRCAEDRGRVGHFIERSPGFRQFISFVREEGAWKIDEANLADVITPVNPWIALLSSGDAAPMRSKFGAVRQCCQDWVAVAGFRREQAGIRWPWRKARCGRGRRARTGVQHGRRPSPGGRCGGNARR